MPHLAEPELPILLYARNIDMPNDRFGSEAEVPRFGIFLTSNYKIAYFDRIHINLHNSIRQHGVRDLDETRDVGTFGVIDVTAFLSVLHTTLVNVAHDDA